MMFEEKPELTPQPRSPLAPLPGPVTGAKAIFWNERELRAGWRLAIFVVLVVFVNLCGYFLTVALHWPQFASTNVSPGGVIVQDGGAFLSALLATAIMGLLESRPFGVYGLPRAGVFGARFWQGAAWGISMITATMLLIRAFGGFSFGELALGGSSLWRYAALWALAFVFVGLFEEFQFRGYAQFTLASGIGFWPAAAILSAAFGAMHIRNQGEDIVGALAVFMIAMFFCLTLRRTGSLWFAVGLHAAFDWGESFVF
jgi:membrane protease YdiL (CAAX protease family)